MKEVRYDRGPGDVKSQKEDDNKIAEAKKGSDLGERRRRETEHAGEREKLKTPVTHRLPRGKKKISGGVQCSLISEWLHLTSVEGFLGTRRDKGEVKDYKFNRFENSSKGPAAKAH